MIGLRLPCCVLGLGKSGTADGMELSAKLGVRNIGLAVIIMFGLRIMQRCLLSDTGVSCLLTLVVKVARL